MSTRRVVVVGAVALALTILALIVPPKTTVNFLGLDLTIVVLFRAVAPFLFVGFLLEALSNWGRRLVRGRPGETLADFARGLAPAFVYMVPAEVLYILLFVAFAVNVPNGWAIFQVLFLPGLLVFPFVFNRKSLWISIRSAHDWLSPKYRKGVERIKAERIPWVPILVDTLYVYVPVMGGVVIANLIVYSLAQNLAQNLGLWSWVASVLFFFVCFTLSLLKWSRPIPPRQPANP